MTKKSDTLNDLSWVTMQMALLAMLLLVPTWGHIPLLVPMRPLGLFLCSAGLALSGMATFQLRAAKSLTPMPSPRDHSELLSSGLYSRVRHPVYSGLLVWALGLAIAAASVFHLFLFAALGVFLNAKAAHEEGLLMQKFLAYSDYLKRTPRFIPRMTIGS